MEEVKTRPALPAGREPRPTREALDEVRRVIVGPERARIRRLEQRPALSPDTVGDVLPEAIAQSHERGEELSIALEAPMTRAVREVARRETGYFANLLAPSIGEAVRKAVAEAIRAMLQRLNEALDRSFSVHGVQWRLEARRTGRSFAEVALLRSLVYRVEHVYLIYTESGLLLEQATAPDVPEPDPDQIAAMLSALETFVREAFERSAEGGHLASFEVGDMVFWVERGRRVTLAALVRGTAPREFGSCLREAVERIELSHRADLRQRPLDVSHFLATRPTLESCLLTQRLPPRNAHAWMIAGAAVLLVGIALVAYALRAHAREERLFAGDVDALRSQPGIVVASAHRKRHHYTFTGLRDPLAADPAEVLARRGVRGADLHFEPFYSLDPRVVERRAARTLGASAVGVHVTIDGGTLRMAGTAPRSWMERTHWLAPTLPGVAAVDERDLHPAEAVAALQEAARSLEAVDVRGFPINSAAIGPSQAMRVRRAAALARELQGLEPDARMRACINVKGHADERGEEAFNEQLSQQRADAVAARLRDHGVAGDALTATGQGVMAGSDSSAEGRSATFHVVLRSATDGAPCAGGSTT
jgi:OOP family OmpA-OmpF porin